MFKLITSYHQAQHVCLSSTDTYGNNPDAITTIFINSDTWATGQPGNLRVKLRKTANKIRITAIASHLVKKWTL
jgi:hypothetical protein